MAITSSLAYIYSSCQDRVPYTNRQRLLATDNAYEIRLGDQQYKQLLQKYQEDILPPSHRASVTVQRVGGRIAHAAGTFARQWKKSNPEFEYNDAPFTYTVVRSDEANAFVLPGNHVFVLTGLFKYVHNEDELASILGHETSHVIARHSGERLTEGLLQALISRLSIVIDPSLTLFSILVPAQTFLYSLPHSREQEEEADQIGLVLASEACYDPKAAKHVFSRMQDDSGQRMPPEFLSTHPSYDTRLTLFDKWMPEAIERYERDGGGKCSAIRSEMKRARIVAAQMHDRRGT